jgi:hypothetical protein
VAPHWPAPHTGPCGSAVSGRPPTSWSSRPRSFGSRLNNLIGWQFPAGPRGPSEQQLAGDHMREVFHTEGANVILSRVRSRKAYAFAERWMRTVRAELLNGTLVLGRRHLDRVLTPAWSTSGGRVGEPPSDRRRAQGLPRTGLRRAVWHVSAFGEPPFTMSARITADDSRRRSRLPPRCGLTGT